MKIICIGRNYRDHVKELSSPLPEKPVFFMKPDSSLLLNDNPFFLPDFSIEMHHEIEIVLRICRLGKKIATRFASRYYDMVTVGIDFTARDIQRQCIKNGNPWEIAKGFDQSAVVGRFVDINTLPDRSAINFCLDINGAVVQQGNTKDLIFSFEEVISYVSGFVTLKTGDLIFTGTPAGVGPVKLGDRLKGTIEGKTLLEFNIK